MKKENLHNELDNRDAAFLQSLPKVEPAFKRSKEAVWASMEAMMDEQAEEPKQAKGKVRSLSVISFSVAAVLVLTLATTAFLRLYTQTVSAVAGEHLTAMLPDGSSIELNSASTLTYHPYWWRFNREVQFEGEGFFKVQKGTSFEVVSGMGRTIVLGTSFNVYARKADYQVTCYTGKVRVVSSLSGASADITPNMQAVVTKAGKVVSSEKENVSETISWRDGMFIFTGTPIQQVFDEIERQYGIQISAPENLHYLYSGNFTRERTADEVLRMVCRSLGLEYQLKNGKYLVVQP